MLIFRHRKAQIELFKVFSRRNKGLFLAQRHAETLLPSRKWTLVVRIEKDFSTTPLSATVDKMIPTASLGVIRLALDVDLKAALVSL